MKKERERIICAIPKDTFLCGIREQENKEEAAFAEYHCEQDFALFPFSLYSIHFDDRNIRVCFEETVEVFDRAPFSVTIFHLCKYFALSALSVDDFFGKIDIADRENALVYIVVQSLFTDAQSFGMSGANVVQ